MKFTAVFSDGRVLTWEGQERNIVEQMCAILASGATYTVSTSNTAE